MKKTLTIALALMMSISLAACAKEPAPPANNPPAASASNTVADNSVNWPNGPITLMIGLSAGGGSDLGCRVFADALSKELGVTVTVENITGGGSWIMWNQLLHNTEPDGNTLGFVNHNIVFGEYDDVNPREDGIDDFDLLCGQLVDYGCVLVRADDDRFNSFEDFVAYARDNDLMTSCTTTGITDGDATCIEAMRKYLDMNITIVPTDGGSDAMTMLLAGDIDFYMNNVSSGVRLAEDGIKMLAQMAPERTSQSPDVPTAKECGFDYSYCSIRGYAYPQNVPEEIRTKMVDAMMAAMERDDYKQAMDTLSQVPTPMNDQEFYDTLMGQLEGRLAVYGLEKH